MGGVVVEQAEERSKFAAAGEAGEVGSEHGAGEERHCSGGGVWCYFNDSVGLLRESEVDSLHERLADVVVSCSDEERIEVVHCLAIYHSPRQGWQQRRNC